MEEKADVEIELVEVEEPTEEELAAIAKAEKIAKLKAELALMEE